MGGNAGSIQCQRKANEEAAFVRKWKVYAGEVKFSTKRKTVLWIYGFLMLVASSVFLFGLPYWSWATRQMMLRMQLGNCCGEGGVGREGYAPRPWVTGPQTERILEQVMKNGSTLCHNVTTKKVEMVGLMEERPVRIQTDKEFRFKLVSVGEDGKARCAGGDYYETDLEGEHWRGRPKIEDNQDGTYEVVLMIDGQKEGLYNFTASLLFGNMHGLDLAPEPWKMQEEITVKVQFWATRQTTHSSGGAVSDNMHMCAQRDMETAGSGGGRWTRGQYNASCAPTPADGRWLCFNADADAGGHCEKPWCDGQVSALESNGWVYSDRQCGFHIFTNQEAWDCLTGRWLFMWGDSNMLDFLRNLLVFGLHYPPPSWANISTWEMNRIVEQTLFVNPHRPDQTLRVSYIFNGHHQTYGDWLGLDSLLDPAYRDSLRLFFNGSSSFPDSFIFNSGLHDGLHFKSVPDFAIAVQRASEFWASVFNPLLASKKRLRFLLRTTVAPAGPARWKPSNPHKMEVFNAILLEGFRQRLPGMQVIDTFDMTFPYHYDFCCSDGGHYGRPPKLNRWPWFGEPHHYFVEVMAVHMMLNSICMAPTSGSKAST